MELLKRVIEPHAGPGMFYEISPLRNFECAIFIMSFQGITFAILLHFKKSGGKWGLVLKKAQTGGHEAVGQRKKVDHSLAKEEDMFDMVTS